MQELTNQAAKIGFADASRKELDQKDKLQKEYEHIKEGIMEELKQEFRPEFLNRIDKIIVFRPLGFEELKKDYPIANRPTANPPAGAKCPA